MTLLKRHGIITVNRIYKSLLGMTFINNKLRGGRNVLSFYEREIEMSEQDAEALEYYYEEMLCNTDEEDKGKEYDGR